MANVKIACYKCKNFERYFTKGRERFNKTQYGLCAKYKRELVNIHERCDGFELRPPARMSRYSIRRNLSELLAELSELRKILEHEECGDGEV